MVEACVLLCLLVLNIYFVMWDDRLRHSELGDKARRVFTRLDSKSSSLLSIFVVVLILISISYICYVLGIHKRKYPWNFIVTCLHDLMMGHVLGKNRIKRDKSRISKLIQDRLSVATALGCCHKSRHRGKMGVAVS